MTSVSRCQVCEAPTMGEEICAECEEAFLMSEEEEDADIGVPSNGKLTEGFRMLKGQGE